MFIAGNDFKDGEVDNDICVYDNDFWSRSLNLEVTVYKMPLQSYHFTLS